MRWCGACHLQASVVCTTVAPPDFGDELFDCNAVEFPKDETDEDCIALAIYIHTIENYSSDDITIESVTVDRNGKSKTIKTQSNLLKESTRLIQEIIFPVNFCDTDEPARCHGNDCKDKRVL